VSVRVRDLDARDRQRWEVLWDAYLAFYETRIPEATTVASWERLLAGEQGMGAQVAVDADDTVLGFAHHVVHPHTWGSGPVCYLEDLMVDPAHRGRGIGRALIEALVTRARETGCESVYWHTDQGNATARRLYDDVASLSPYVRYEIEL
jgi:GNAT superfamily N-acetyltransferase